MKKKLHVRKGWKSVLLFFFLFAGLSAIKAQTIMWDGIATGLTPSTITISGDAAELRFVFVATGGAVNNANIEVSLPTGYTGTSVGNGSTMAGGISYATSGIGTNVVTVTITDGTLVAGKSVDLILSVKAGCSAIANGDADIRVKSGATVLDTRSVAIVGAYPALRVQSATPNQTNPTVGHVFNFDLELDVSNSLVANSFKLTLGKVANTTLTNFKLDGVAVTPTTNNATTVEFTFNNLNLSSTIKHLTFDASDIYAGAKNISTKLQYLSGSGGANCGSAITGPTFTFGAPAVPGAPAIAIVSAGYVAAPTSAGPYLNATTQVPMDGSETYFRVVYKNTGSAPTKQLKQSLQVFRMPVYSYANIVEDVSKVKYSVDNGVTIKNATTVTFTDRNPLDNGYRKLKAAYNQKPRYATITIDEPLPAGKELIVFWPMQQGAIYDNTGYNPTVFASANPWASIQWNSYTIAATDQNGAAVAVPQNTYGAGGITHPLFASTPPSLSFRETGALSQQQVTIFTEFGSVGGNQYSELYIKLPSWLTLDGSPNTAITTSGIAAGYPQAAGLNTYVVRAAAGGKRNVTIKYKVDGTPCSGVNQTGEIYYWLDFVLGGATSARPILKEIGQIRQPVTLLCAQNGIVMDDFKPFRISRGLVDSDNNKVPDNTTLAPDADIMHDTYLIEDKGKLIVKGTVKASYGALYLQLSSSTLNLTTQQMSSATIKVNGGVAQAMTLTGSGQSLSFSREASFNANDQVEIEIPFTAKTSNVTATVKAELYMAASLGGTRVGNDELFVPLNMYAPNFGADKGNELFVDNNPKNVTLAYLDNYHGNNFQAPYFDKEYRSVAKLKNYEITLPPGYVLSPISAPTLKITKSGSLNLDPKANIAPFDRFVTAVTKTTLASGSTKYSFDLTTVFKDAYWNNGTYAALTANEWLNPDDYYSYNFYTDIIATPAAVAAGNIVNTGVFSYYADNHTAQNRMASRTYPVAYTGDKATLALSATSVTAYNRRITLPVLGVSNASNAAKPMWLYIKEGDASFTVSNVSAKPTSGGTAISGIGNGKWINLGTRGANSTTEYELSFDISTIPCSGSKQVEIYLFTDFATSFAPNTLAAPTNANYSDHMGDSKTLSFSASTAAIAGSISVNDNSIKYQVPYTFTAELSASGGQGDVYDGQMVITVPAGQKFANLPGSAKYIYNGATTNVPAAVQAAINTALGGGSVLANARTYTFKVSDFIAGDNLSGGGSGAPANKQTIQLIMDFTSECETDLLNTFYTATIAGKTVCGNSATGNGNRVADLKMNYTSSIVFTAATSMQKGIDAFNEIHKEDTLLLDLEKTFGSGNLTANDYVEIIMHENIDIKSGGTIVVGSTTAAVDGASVAINANTTAAGKRTMKIALPWNELNSQPSGGQHIPFIYKIPLAYFVSDTVSPENKIKINVQNEVKLHSSCPPQMFPVGSDELDFGLVVGNTNPDTVYIGDALPLHITSAGFTGGWYDAPTGGALISTANPYMFTPTDMSLLGDTTFYFSAEFGSNNYGRLPYNVKVFIHPSFIRDLDTMAIACKDEEILSVEAIGMDLKYQWYYNLTTPIAGATDTFYVAKQPGYYHVIATDSVGESVSSDTLNLYLNVVPEFTKDLPKKARECDRWGYTLEVETTGHHLMYQWYRDGVAIPGANSRTYYAVANDSSAFFRVSVKTVCGDSIMSQQCYLSFCDEDESVHINREIRLIAPNTVKTDPAPGISQVQSHTDFTFTVKAVDGYGLKYMDITTDDPVWTEQGGIVKEEISENEIKVTVLTITKPLTITVEGISPVSNEDLEDTSCRAWAYDGKLYIQTEQDETVYIYTTMGHLYRRVDVEAGLTSFDVVDGVYFVTFSNGYSGKVFVK